MIGEPEFVPMALAADTQRRARIARYQKDGWNVLKLATAVSKKYRIQPEVLERRTKEVREARKVFCFIGSKELAMTHAELGEYLGISVAGIWLLAKQGKVVIDRKKIRIES